MERLHIAQEADRLTVAAILIKNGYTVRQGKAKRQGKNSYEYFIEYTEAARPNDGLKAAARIIAGSDWERMDGE